MYSEAQQDREMTAEEAARFERQRQAQMSVLKNPIGAGAANYGADTPKRTTAASVMENRLWQLRREIDGLEALLRALPRELPHEAEEALWKLVVNQRA